MSAYYLDEDIAYANDNIEEFLTNVRPYFYTQKYNQELNIKLGHAAIINPLLLKNNINGTNQQL